MKRCIVAVVIVVALLLGLGYWLKVAKEPPVSQKRESEQLPTQLVSDLHAAFGEHQVRAVHAKGIVLEGEFTPSVDGKAICRAGVFERTVLVTVRFSNFTGFPDIPDTKYDASPRGFAVKFLLPIGSKLDVVSHSFNGFPVAKASEFGELFRAIGASGPESAKPTALDQFLDSHPVAKTFLTTQKPPPESYATCAYFGVNAFQFTDAEGRVQNVRYRFVPDAGEKYLDEVGLKQKGPNYLTDEIRGRVADSPVRFTWYAQIAEAGDDVENPSIAWPEARKLVKLGVLSIDRLGANTPESDRALLFLPGSLIPGIAIVDPMVSMRNGAYPVSFRERQK